MVGTSHGRVPRNNATGYDGGRVPEFVHAPETARMRQSSYGDRILESRLSLDADGRPEGNRHERRMMTRYLRKGG